MYLARGLVLADSKQGTNGFTVTVVTQTPRTEEDVSNDPLFRIVRKPGAWELWRLIGNADRVLLAGPAILPLAFAFLPKRHAFSVRDADLLSGALRGWQVHGVCEMQRAPRKNGRKRQNSFSGLCASGSRPVGHLERGSVRTCRKTNRPAASACDS